MSQQPVSDVLSAKQFVVLFRWALRRARRYPEFVTLVTIRVTREYQGASVAVGSQTLTEVAGITIPLLRAADFVGLLPDGRLGVALLETDTPSAHIVIERIVETIAAVQFPGALTFEIGAATCPTDGTNVRSLASHATTHPLFKRPGVTARRAIEGTER